MVSLTSSRPDMALVSISVVTKNEENFNVASSRMKARYGSLVSDLDLTDFSVS